jgi:hypothetical protein
MQATGQLDEITGQLLSTALRLGLFIAFLPLQQLVAAGAFVAFGNWIRNQDVSYSALYTSVRQAIQAFLYGIIAFAINFLLLMVMIVPAGGITYVAVIAAGPMAGLGVASLALLVALPPLIYVGLGLQLGTYAVVLDDVTPLEALQISWEAAAGNRLYLFILNFAIFIVGAFAGACTFCLLGIGAVPVQGLAMAGMTLGWLLHSRRMEETTKWDFVERNLPYL